MNIKTFLLLSLCVFGMQPVRPRVHIPPLVGRVSLVGRALTALMSWRTESELLQAQKDMKAGQEETKALVSDGVISEEEAQRRIYSLQSKVEDLTNALKWSHVLDATLGANEQAFLSFNSSLEQGAGILGVPAIFAAFDKERVGKKRFLRLFLLATDLLLGGLIQKQPLAVREPNRDATLQSMSKVTTRVRFLKVLRRVVRILYKYHLVGGKSRSARFTLLIEALSLLGGLRRAKAQKVERRSSANLFFVSDGEELASGAFADDGERVVYFDRLAPFPMNEQEREAARRREVWEKNAQQLGRMKTEELGVKIEAADETMQMDLFYSLLTETRVKLLNHYYEKNRDALPAFLFGNGDTRGALYQTKLQVTSFKSSEGSFFKGENLLNEIGGECCLCLDRKPDALILSLQRRDGSEHLLRIKKGNRVVKEKTRPLNEGETVARRYEMCQHAFCLPCIVKAGVNKQECPICRAPMSFIYHYPSVHTQAGVPIDSE